MRRSAPIAAAGIVCLLLAPAVQAASKRGTFPRKRGPAERALTEAKRVVESRGVRTGREPTGALRELAIRLPALSRDDRREARGLLARPDGPDSEPEGTWWDGGDALTSPSCSANFCVHWPALPTDALDLSPTDGNANLVPDYVDSVLNELQNVIRPKEVGTLGWQAPPPDGTLGGDSKTDVYIVDFGNDGAFGVSVPDPDQTGSSRHGFMLLDDDYGAAEYGSSETPLDFMRVTAAHEYNHVLQFGYDVFQDNWMAESSAVWMEDEVYPAIDDYLRYLDDWAQLPSLPLTYFNLLDDSDPLNVKAYGDAVWNRWLDTRYGPSVIRDAWEASILTNPGSFGPAAYDAAIRAAGGKGFFDEFTRFAAATAEWRAATSGMSEPSWTGVPDVHRLAGGDLPLDGDFLEGELDHTAYALASIAATSRPLKLIAIAPAGDDAAFALVGRSGETVSTHLVQRPNGGGAVATLTNPGDFERLTAVLVNADFEPATFDGSDWVYARDGQLVRAYLSTDFTAPGLAARSPKPGATRVSTGARPSATFSEGVNGVSATSFRLTGPGGTSVPATVSYDGQRNKAVLRPDDDLSDTTRYTVWLGPGILDRGANAFAATKWSFTTIRRPPRFSVSVRSRQRRSTVLSRGVLVRLRSTDADTLRFAAVATASRGQLAAAARTVGRKRVSLRSGRKRRLRVRLKRVAKLALRRGPLRLKLKLTVRDPQGNVRRVKRRVLIR
jgi:hypothetical protein